MRLDTPEADRGATSRRALPARWRAACAILAGLALLGLPARAEPRWLLEGLLDAELWDTDSRSIGKTRNEGDLSSETRLKLWAAAELHPRLQLLALTELAGGNADDESGYETEVEQAYLRVLLGPRKRLFFELGRLPLPVGNFSRRYLSDTNPLIGAPNSYDVSYPFAAQLAGSASIVDYRIAVMDQPMSNAVYLPEPDAAPRPAAAVGITPITGLRVGAYLTRGPYLNRDLGAGLPPGADWKDYRQQVAGLDFHFSRGYLEINADYALADHEVPTVDGTFRNRPWFVEPKYTWSPRLFTALRYEHADYVFVRWTGASWLAVERLFRDLEVGVGYRVAARTLLKLDYRTERWDVDAALRGRYPDGHSIALQLSHGFDVRSWFQPLR